MGYNVPSPPINFPLSVTSRLPYLNPSGDSTEYQTESPTEDPNTIPYSGHSEIPSNKLSGLPFFNTSE